MKNYKIAFFMFLPHIAFAQSCPTGFVEYDIPGVEIITSGACPSGYVAYETVDTCTSSSVGACWLAGVLSCVVGQYMQNDECMTCPIGSYCADGNVATPCPDTGKVDKNGELISATTITSGATSVSDCIIRQGVLFRDGVGVYRYSDSCSYVE